MMNEVLKNIATRSSIRAYKADPLKPEELQALITAGLQAPTAANRQEFHLTVVPGNHPVLQEIEDAKNAQMAAANPGRPAPATNFWFNAPHVIFVSADKNMVWGKFDAGIVAENIHLAAHSMGLGSIMVGCIRGAMEGEQKEHFAKMLQFPENYEYAIAVPVGYRDTEKAPHTFDAGKQVTIL